MRNRCIVGIVACFALTFGIGLLAQAQGASSIQGTITAQGAVVPNAQVSAINTSTNVTRTTTSNATGEFSLVDIPVGHYKVTVRLDGFAERTTEANVSVASAVTLNIDILAPEQNGQITVVVVDTGKHPIPNVHVSIQKSTGETYEGVTDDAGKWIKSSLGGGKYTISATGVGPPAKKITLADNRAEKVELTKK